MPESEELSVSEARDRFSDAVNRASFGHQVTYITRGRGRTRAAAIVPIEWLDEYEALLDREDARLAQERLDEVRSGRADAVSADDAFRQIGL